MKIIRTDKCEITGTQLEGIQEFIIPIPLGKKTDILQLPEEETIKFIENKPFGIYYENDKVWGRILTNKEYLPLVIVTSKGRVLKIKLKPHISNTFKI